MQPVKMRVFLPLLCVLLVSCGKEGYEFSNQHTEELFWVTYQESTMPVVVSGNSASDIVILKVHGGPGGSSVQEFQAADWVEAFENDYLMAYWDQPFAGYSINESFPDIETFDLSYFRKSLAAVTAFIRLTYPGKKIVLWGQSWGGLVVCDFITETENQASYDGWILESALNTNGLRDHNGLRESMMQVAAQRAAAGETRWAEELTWMEQNPYIPGVWDRDLWFRYEGYADELLGDLDPDPSLYIRKRKPRNHILRQITHRQRSQYNVFGSAFNSDLFTSDKVYTFNKDPQIPNITKKGLFIQGKLDRSVSAISSEAFSVLVGPLLDFKMYPNSGHNPSIVDYDLFVADVKLYLEQL